MEKIVARSVGEVVDRLIELRYARRQSAPDPRRWSQRALAHRLGWAQSQLAEYEAQRTTPGFDNLAHWAAQFDLELSLTLTSQEGQR